MDMSILISTGKATVICPDATTAREYATDLIETALERLSSPFTLRIEHRTAAEVKRFLAGEQVQAPAKEKTKGPTSDKPKEPPAKDKKATAEKPAKQHVTKKPTTSLKILQCIAGADKPITTAEVSARTNIAEHLAGVHVSNLHKAAKIKSTDTKPKKYYVQHAPSDKKPGAGSKIKCLRCDQVITKADCVPNHENKWCQACEHSREAA